MRYQPQNWHVTDSKVMVSPVITYHNCICRSHTRKIYAVPLQSVPKYWSILWIKVLEQSLNICFKSWITQNMISILKSFIIKFYVGIINRRMHISFVNHQPLQNLCTCDLTGGGPAFMAWHISFKLIHAVWFTIQACIQKDPCEIVKEVSHKTSYFILKILSLLSQC